MEIFGKSKAVAAGLQGADGLLKCLLIVLANGHDLAHSLHLRAQLVLGAFKFLKGPAGKFDDYIVAGGLVIVQGSLLPVGNLVQGQAAGQQGGDIGDGEARGLGGQSGGPGGAGIDFDDDNPVCLGVVGKLDVGAADDADGLHDGVGLAFQPVLNLLGNGQHGGAAEGVAGVDAHGVDIFNEADGDFLALGVADYLHLQLLPADDRFFNQNLVNHGGSQAPGRDLPQLLLIVHDAAAGPAHGIGGADDHGIAQLRGDGEGLIHRVGRSALCHLDSQLVHGLLEGNPVLAPVDGIHLDADNLYVVFVQDAGGVELLAKVQAGLAAQVGQEGIRALLGDNLGQTVHIQGFNVGGVGCGRVCHDGGRV